MLCYDARSIGVEIHRRAHWFGVTYPVHRYTTGSSKVVGTRLTDVRNGIRHYRTPAMNTLLRQFKQKEVLGENLPGCGHVIKIMPQCTESATNDFSVPTNFIDLAH